MTQQQLIQEFKSYPKAKQFEVICELAKIYEADLEKHIRKGHKLSIDEEKTINRLREIVAIGLKNQPTKNL